MNVLVVGAGAVGSAVARSLHDTTSTWLAILIGTVAAAVGALVAVGLMSLFTKR